MQWKIVEITDEKLFCLCQHYGENARMWRQKFIGLLPEVFKRKLYLRKGFSSIFEFAAKLAGVSEEQVSRVLNLEERFQDKPDLHDALVSGEVSINKLARVAAVATPENQRALTDQVKILPKSALEMFVRDEKRAKIVPGHNSEQQSSIRQAFQFQLQVPKSGSEPILSQEVKSKLYELQQKGININEFILAALKKREEEIAHLKQKLADEQNCGNITRYIPVKIKQILNQEYGTKCSVPSCQKQAQQIHHELPFAMVRNHNPFFIKPLCKEHHQIAHSFQLAYGRHML